MIRIVCIIENRDIQVALSNYLNRKIYNLKFIFKVDELKDIENSADLFLIEGEMLKLDSVSFFIHIKLNTKLNKTPVILIDNSKNNISDFFILKGIDDYVHWPFSRLQLNKRIDNFMTCKITNSNINKIVEEKVEELSEVQSVMIESLGTLAEYRDPETGGHIKRTQNYVKALAIYLMKHNKFKSILTEENIELMYLSVPLHDIGKVGIRDEILLKPGKLTDEEFELMKLHTIFGHETIQIAERKLKNNAFLKFADDVAYTHQEKWNGTGYPRGLKGEEIPLIGRLMAVADVYDALISKRVYKRAMSHEEAKAIIVDGSGSHFDPVIVEAFLAIEDTFRNISIIYSDYDKETLLKENLIDFENNSKVLLIDDSKLMLTIFTNQLINAGYTVITAKNGKEALEIIEKDKIDIILTDLEMPIMDGYEFIKILRKNMKNHTVIALTAADFNLTKDQIINLGFNDFMLKPLDTNLLKIKLSKLLRGQM